LEMATDEEERNNSNGRNTFINLNHLLCETLQHYF
jgi:hypothetical protein